MKPRNTLLLLIVCTALLAYVWFVERHRKGTREAGEAAGLVAEVDRDKIDTVTIQNPDGTIELRKGGNNEWFLEKPAKDRADSRAISQLFTTLEDLRHDSTFPAENKDQLKEFGVDESNTKVRLNGKGEKEFELLIGKDAAVEGKTYVRAQGSDTVYVIRNDLKNQLNKKTDEFRDRRLAHLTTQEVNRMSVATKEGEIELEKKDNHWMVTKPLKARGDDQKINDLIAAMTTAQIDQFLTDSSNLTTYGLAEPRGTVSFFTEGSEKPVVLQIGANGQEEKDKEKTFAKLSTRDSVVLVPKAIEKILESRPNDLRDRNLVRVESDIVDRITIEVKDKPQIVLSRKGESWVRKEGDNEAPINDTLANRLLADLKNTEVSNFVADTATDLQKFGLDQPQMKVTLSSYASENTPESKAGDKPIVAVLFGNVEGDHGYAKVDDEPFIVAVPRFLIEIVPTDPVQLQDLKIYTQKPENVTTLELTKDGQPPLSLEKDKEGIWKLAKGDGSVNQTNVQSLVNTLSSLRAVKWIGETTPDHGFEKPAVETTFSVSEGEKKTTSKLTIGSPTPDELYYSTAEGLVGTFALSKPDRDAFDLPLIDKPAPQTQAPTPPMVEPGTPPPAPEPAVTTEVPAPTVQPEPAPAPLVQQPATEAVTPPVQAPPPAPENNPAPAASAPKPPTAEVLTPPVQAPPPAPENNPAPAASAPKPPAAEVVTPPVQAPPPAPENNPAPAPTTEPPVNSSDAPPAQSQPQE